MISLKIPVLCTLAGLKISEPYSAKVEFWNQSNMVGNWYTNQGLTENAYWQMLKYISLQSSGCMFSICDCIFCES